MRYENKGLIGLETCKVLVRSVLESRMYCINNLKVKELWVLLHHHFGSEHLKGIPNKVELVESVKDF